MTNCATRLRLTVADVSQVADETVFKEFGAHGLVKKDNALQIIVGLDVPQVREEFELLMNYK